MPAIGNKLECSFTANIVTMLYGNSKPDVMKYNLPLWFLTCFFVVSILAYLVEHTYRKYGNVARYTALFICGISNIYFSKYENIALPWHFETALSMLVWFVIGILMKEHSVCLTRILHIKNKYIMKSFPIVFIALGGGIALLNTRTLGVRNEHYGVIPVYYVAAALGVIGFVELSLCVKKCRLLEYIGKKSMALLVLHKFPILFFQEFFTPIARILDEPDSIPGLVCGTLVLIITVFSILLIEKVIDRFLPWTLGYIESSRIK